MVEKRNPSDIGEWTKKLKRLDPLLLVLKGKRRTFFQFSILNYRGVYASEDGDYYIWFCICDERPPAWIISGAEQFAQFVTNAAPPECKAFSESQEYLPSKVTHWFNSSRKVLKQISITALKNYVYSSWIVSGSREKARNGRYFQCCDSIFWNGMYYLWQPFEEDLWYITTIQALMMDDPKKCLAFQKTSGKWFEIRENKKFGIAKDLAVQPINGSKGDGWAVLWCGTCEEHLLKKTINNGTGSIHPRTQCANSGKQQTFSKSPFLKLVSGPYYLKSQAEKCLDEINNESDSESESESESASTDRDSQSSSGSESRGDEESPDEEQRFPISPEDTLEITSYLVGLCSPQNFQNDAAAAKFGKNIFASLHKDLGDLCRLKRIRRMEPDEDLEVVGSRIYNFPEQVDTAHKMLLYSWGVRRKHASMRTAKKYIRIEFKRVGLKLKDMFRDAWNYEHNEKKAEFEAITRSRQAIRLRKRKEMVAEQEARARKKEENLRVKRAKSEAQNKKVAALKKVRTMWSLQKRIESQSILSLQKLQKKYRFFRERLLKARERKEACYQFVEGRKEIDINDPLGFMKEEDIPGDLIIPN